MRKVQFFTIFALLLFAAIGYKTYEQYQRISHTKHLILQNESRSLANFIEAFRQTYQDVFLKHDINITDQTLHLLPVKTIREISKHFSKSVKGDIVIRTVSDRPRNPENKANAFEMKMIDLFKTDPDMKEQFVQVDGKYHYVKPLYTKASCLKCHGKRTETIPSIRKRYDSAYDYKLGELRGIMNITVKRHEFFDVLYADFRNTVITTCVIYILFLVLIYFLLQSMRKKEERYTQHLKDEIKTKTSVIQKQKDTFETLFEKSADGTLIISGERVLECNEKAVQMFGYASKKELVNHTLKDFSPMFQSDNIPSSEKMKEMITLAKQHQGYQFEWESLKKNGDTFFSEIILTPIILNGSEVLHMVIRDISEKKKAQEKLIEQKNMLYYQAHHDALTGLPNRTLFNDRLAHGIEHTKRNNTILALFFIDLDHFKNINDSLGHQVGDKVLKIVAQRLKASLRHEDTLTRLGGDEFTIIMEDIQRMRDIYFLADKIQKVLSQPMDLDGHTLRLTGSMGISICPQDTDDPNELVKYADTAMYQAKEEGRNSYRFYSKEMTTLAFERLVMEENLQQALENKEFRLYYQPQFDTRTGEISGLEALIRWEHPKLGLLLPDQFIPLAEESELILKIDRWVMRTAMEQFVQWYEEGLNPGRLGLNLVIRQLNSNDFIRTLEECIAQTGFLPSWLILEISEEQVMSKPDEYIKKLQILHDMGITVAIDDFGTGYSSLVYLRRLPVSMLKIDHSIIEHIPENTDSVAIVKAIIALTESLGISVVAEGVEEEKQKISLMEYGYYYMQGYYYCKPVVADEIEKLLLKK